MSNRRIKCKIRNVGSEKTRQVHGYEKQNRQEAGRVASAISMTRYDKHACCFSSIFFVRSHASFIKVTSSWQFPQAQWLSCKLWAPKSGWHFAYVTRYFSMFRCRFENFAHCSTIVYDSQWPQPWGADAGCGQDAYRRTAVQTSWCPAHRDSGVQPQRHGRLKIISTSMM